VRLLPWQRVRLPDVGRRSSFPLLAELTLFTRFRAHQVVEVTRESVSFVTLPFLDRALLEEFYGTSSVTLLDRQMGPLSVTKSCLCLRAFTHFRLDLKERPFPKFCGQSPDHVEVELFPLSFFFCRAAICRTSGWVLLLRASNDARFPSRNVVFTDRHFVLLFYQRVGPFAARGSEPPSLSFPTLSLPPTSPLRESRVAPFPFSFR